ncbi:catalytic domain of ctd-like phosphatases [Teratosphaeria destructans]|uniref:Mitochondrial import inner membrane translocase subunit TIM50 n=1 Tax=Teratosphaeria destructans TaxID=418781 RepID=A0A9W7SZ69_9PEZI|nr:catalytic domain of ctd-like phosphatases [Teratosphaeria destructans]
MRIPKHVQRCDDTSAIDTTSAIPYTDMDQYRPMFGIPFREDDRAAGLNEDCWDQRVASMLHQPEQTQLRGQDNEAPQWEVDDRSWQRPARWNREYGSAVRQGREPSAWQQGQQQDHQWSEGYGYGSGYDSERGGQVYGLGQPAYTAQGPIYPTSYAQEDCYARPAYQREQGSAFYPFEWPRHAQAQEETSQDRYAQSHYYPQPSLSQAFVQEQDSACNYWYGNEDHWLMWQTVNNVPSYSSNTNGFAAINRPMPQQWNTPSAPTLPLNEQYSADRHSSQSKDHHISYTTTSVTNSRPIDGQYQANGGLPPPPPQASRLTKNQRKKLKANQQEVSSPPSPPELTEAELGWISNSRAIASPNSPRLRVMPRPQPDGSYLHQANMPILPLGSPRTLLVVLDLNGTLLHRKSKGSNFTTRPHVSEFLHYLLTNHTVMIWSSARPDNVKAMCGKLFTKPQMQQLIAVWARDKLRLAQKFYNQKVQVYKQLSWVWEELAAGGNGIWDQSNTVLIDDSMEKAASEPHNLVQIEEFEGRADQQSTDVLGQVVRYLEVARDYSDVSSFMREYPFTYLPEDALFDWSEMRAGMR